MRPIRNVIDQLGYLDGYSTGILDPDELRRINVLKEQFPFSESAKRIGVGDRFAFTIGMPSNWRRSGKHLLSNKTSNG